MRKTAHIVLGLLLVMLGAPAGRAGEPTIIDPIGLLQTATRTDFVGQSDIAIIGKGVGCCLRMVPRNSAAGLHLPLDLPGTQLTRVEWTWLVEPIQRSADVRVIKREDFAAKLAFIFGEPTFWNKDVPTIAYIWTSSPVPNGTLLPSLRFANLRYIQLRGSPDAGTWQSERRNIREDFVRAFGHESGRLHYMAVFNDNDQTLEPVAAQFGRIIFAD